MFIENENPDTSQFDFNLKKGGAVIFDELSVHRGSAPKKTDRIVLRFIYKKIFKLFTENISFWI